MSIPLNELPAEDFETLVGQSLPARVGEQRGELAVERVWRSPYPTGRAIPGFSLFLRGALQWPLQQGTICLSHPQHGELELFMTQVGRDASGYQYEIVFN